MRQLAPQPIAAGKVQLPLSIVPALPQRERKHLAALEAEAEPDDRVDWEAVIDGLTILAMHVVCVGSSSITPISASDL